MPTMCFAAAMASSKANFWAECHQLGFYKSSAALDNSLIWGNWVAEPSTRERFFIVYVEDRKDGI